MAKQNTTQAAQADAAAAAAVADAGVVSVTAPVVAPVAAPVSGVPGSPTVALDREHQADRVAMTERRGAEQLDAADRALAGANVASERPAGYLLIVCSSPGLRRAGLVHGTKAEYPLDFFTARQLELLRGEKRLQVIEVGGVAEPRPEDRRIHRHPLIDPVAAGDAAADAISNPPNRARPGMRNAMAGTGEVGGFRRV